MKYSLFIDGRFNRHGIVYLQSILLADDGGLKTGDDVKFQDNDKCRDDVFEAAPQPTGKSNGQFAKLKNFPARPKFYDKKCISVCATFTYEVVTRQTGNRTYSI